MDEFIDFSKNGGIFRTIQIIVVGSGHREGLGEEWAQPSAETRVAFPALQNQVLKTS